MAFIFLFFFLTGKSQESAMNCIFIDSTSGKLLTNPQKAQINSENGWVLPATGTIRILLVFAEIDDPSDPGTSEWPDGQLPKWVNGFLDLIVSFNPQGELTKYFYQASSGNLNIVGDYLLAPVNGGVFQLSQGTSPSLINLRNEINSVMNGNFVTGSGITNPLVFDNWSKTDYGLAKITPSQDSLNTIT